MEERNDGGEKLDEVMLPGFRFHPTDEELVGFYLKRKIQQRPLTIELIKQLDIYKYDPWDLPKLATTGEKEWYFYCPRDRKYRNSARPNRVTRAGFWKATGTDRPIYSSSSSSEGNNSSNKCIGLKKSLVFYKGRAAKGVKTDWMMHEFRLPSLTDSFSTKKYLDKTNIPANESWAICRIFKKTNSTAQRALSHSWVSSPLEPNTTSDNNMLTKDHQNQNTHFCPSNNNMPITNNSISNLCPFDIASYKSIINPFLHKALFDHHHHHLPSFSNVDLISNNNNSLVFSSSPPLETSNTTNPKSTIDFSSTMLLNNSQVSSNFCGGFQDQCGGGYYQMQETIIGNNNNSNYQCGNHDDTLVKYFPYNNNNVHRSEDQDDDDLEALRSVEFQFGMPNFNIGDEWKSNLVHWDACDIVPSSYSTTKCYT